MVTILEGRVRLLCDLDGPYKGLLELLNAFDGGRPALDGGRLDDDQLDFGCAVKHPLRLGGTHGGGCVEHKLLVLLGGHRHARAKLPIKNDGLIANAAHQVGRAKDTRQQITKADTGFDCVLHCLVGVYFIKQV